MTIQTPAEPSPQTPPGADSGPAGQNQESPRTRPTATEGGPGQLGTESQAQKPDWLPDSYWDAEKSEPKAADLKKFWDGHIAARASLPDKPEGYKLAVPEDIKLPPGYTPDEKEPKFNELRRIALEDGLSQATVDKLVRLEAASIAAYHEGISKGITLRDKALGDNGAGRVAVLEKFIEAHWPDAAEARQIKDTMWTPVIVKHFENYQKMVSGQGVHSFNQTGREAPQGNGLPPGHEKWSPTDRRTWQLTQQQPGAR